MFPRKHQKRGHRNGIFLECRRFNDPPMLRRRHSSHHPTAVRCPAVPCAAVELFLRRLRTSDPTPTW